MYLHEILASRDHQFGSLKELEEAVNALLLIVFHAVGGLNVHAPSR